jgi:ABC-2 type transport system permease protein
MFYSPLAWTLLSTVLFILALLFLILVEHFLTTIQPRLAAVEGAPGVTDAIIAPLLLWAGVLMLVVIPLLSMRVVSEERQNGSLRLLTSAPISVFELIMGKYLGLLMLILVMLTLLALMPLSLTLGTSLDWGKFGAGLLGLFLLTASFAAAGLYLSCVATTPFLAALSSFGLLIFLVVLYISGSSEGSASALFVYLSHFSHFMSFLKGIFNSADLVYYLLFITVFMTLAIRHMNIRRLRR